MSPINALIEKITEYLRIKIDQVKLEVSGHVAKILAITLSFLIIGLLTIFLLFFISITAAVYLNSLLDSEVLGYAIVSGVLILKVIILFIFLRSGRFQRMLEDMILKITEDE